MSCYNYLAPWYDSLTGDVPYGEFADFYESEFRRDGGEFKRAPEVGCGPGALSWEGAARGYEVIAVDSSVDMLMQAQGKSLPVETPPLFLCQDASLLDLYGTVDAAVCTLDGMNYIPPDALQEVFRRLHLFVRPGGLLIFDIRTPEFLRSLDGSVFVDETDDVLCLWRADFDEELSAIVYGMDIFSRRKSLWNREREEHVEYAHAPEMLKALLESEGFTGVRLTSDAPQGDSGRLFIIAKR